MISYIEKLSVPSKYYLSHIIYFTLIQSKDKYYFAENSELGIYANGLTESSAIDDFCNQLIYLYEFYRDNPDDQLIGEAIRLKKFFKHLLI